MRTIAWNRGHLDGVLEALVTQMLKHPTYSTRYKTLHATFRRLGNAALAEEPFTIAVEPSLKYRGPDPSFQHVVDEVRERRRAACAQQSRR